MLRRAFVLLGGTFGLAACGSSNTGPQSSMNQPVGQSLGMTPPPGLMQGPPISGPVAILLPLTGRMADVGRPMLRAAQLALSVPGSPMLDAKDTGGTPEGAVQAAAEAIQAGDRLILGPVTSSETAQVAPVARRGAVPVLAFTNDSSQAQPGVWTLGITPGQQVRRLWAAARDSNHLPIAAILPDNDFGRAMGDELTRVTAAAGQPAPFTRMIGSGAEAINGAVNELAGLAPADQPPQYGALMLASIGNDLKIFAKAIADAKIDRARVQILGPALWVDPASGSSALPGAWFAMPDPEARRDMVRDYTAKYKEPPRPVADLAYDAASIARVLSSQGRMTMQGLVQPQGFTGVDGWFALLPEGQVRRGLAVFRVGRQPAEKIADAPGGPTS